MAQTIFNVGHNSLSFMQFLSLIQANHINHIVDIRSVPYSKYTPWSDKSRLSEFLRPFKIKYTYLGHKLGGLKTNQPMKPAQVSVTTHQTYDEGFQLIIQLSMRTIIALLCTEDNPGKCHRQDIIAQTLLNTGTQVWHIFKDGSIKETWIEEQKPVQPLRLRVGYFSSALIPEI